jgi:predicted DNA-binding transcriptional regulator AlpA
MNSVITVAPILLDSKAAARLCGLGRTSFLQNDRLGIIGPRSIRLTGKVLWCRTELEEWAKRGCPGRTHWLTIWAEIVGEKK